jgi:hypothetical protein
VNNHVVFGSAVQRAEAAENELRIFKVLSYSNEFFTLQG